MEKKSLIKDVEMFLDDKPSVYAIREKARLVVEKNGFPNKKNEAWKYTDIKEILNRDFDIVRDDIECDGNCGCESNKKDLDDNFIKIRFCKGRIHLEEYNLPKGIRVVGLPEVLFEGEYKKYLLGAVDIEKHPFGALNTVYLCEGVVIEVEKGVKCEKPLVISYHNDNISNKMVNIHNLIILKKGAELEVVEEYCGSQHSSCFINVVNEIYLEENSVCKHYKVQKEEKEAYNIGLNAVKVYKSAVYEQYYCSKGAKISRNETLIDLEDVGAKADVYSMYVAKKESFTDITTNVNHKVKDTNSNQYAKAVLEEGSGACFQGKVKIYKDAVKSVGNQLHKALYLGDNAELDCKPELEIYADDVKCSHGASSGEIDNEQLFYLVSRGISEVDAKNMLIDAHLEEILSYIENDSIKEKFFL